MVDSPSGGAPAKAPRWDLADTEGYGGGNYFSLAPFDILFLRNSEIGKKTAILGWAFD